MSSSVGEAADRNRHAQGALQTMWEVHRGLVYAFEQPHEPQNLQRLAAYFLFTVFVGAEECLEEARARTQVLANEHVLQHRELVKQRGRLKGSHQATLGDGAGAKPRDVFILEYHATGCLVRRTR